MPVFKVQAPDGTVIKIEATDEATAMRGAQEHYASLQKPAKAAPAPKKPNTAMDAAKSYVSGLGESLTSMIPQATFGGDMVMGTLRNAATVASGINNVLSGRRPEVKPGVRMDVGSANNLMASVPGIRYTPQTTAGKWAKTAGAMTPNAAAPGSALQRTAAVVLPTVGSEGAGELVNALGAGPKTEAAARFVGGLAGGALASLRTQSRDAVSPVVRGQNADDMRNRLSEYRTNGINPTLADVVDDSGRGVIRAAATRQTPGRQAVTDFRDARALDLPSRMSEQARNVLSNDPRTPDAIRAEMVKARGDNAKKAFGAVRGDVVDLGDDAMTTFRVPQVANAVADAVSRERDPAVRGALARLEQWARSGQAPANAPPITIGMADRVSRVLLSKGRGAMASDPDLGATLTDFGNLIRQPAKQASTGYASALKDFGADSRLVEAADVGENLLKGNTDEFVAQAQGLSDPERQLALAAGRRAIERASGENISAAPGVARKLAVAPEQQARNAALMGTERANRLQSGMRMEERAVQNANEIAPKVGSKTAGLQQDVASLAENGLNIVQKGLRGDAIGLAMDWLKSRGMNDRQAEQLLQIAIDPAQTERAIRLIEQQSGPEEAAQFRRLLMAATGTSAATQALIPQQ